MSDQYFIVTADGQKSGPYDLVGVVKKIRNGSVGKDAMVATDKKPAPAPIASFAELAEFLNEQSTEETRSEEAHDMKSVTLAARLRNGWAFLQNNQLSTIFSGLLTLFIIFLAGIVGLFFPTPLLTIGYSLVFVVIQFAFSAYIYSVLRMVRGQPVDVSFIRAKVKPVAKPLLTTSVMMSLFLIIGLLLMLSGGQVLAIIGLVIASLPGFYLMSLFIFAPLLILDKDMEFWEALELSRKTVQKSGVENTGVIFSLLIINFLAGMVFLIPLIISLPITIAAIAEMYDETFI